jgi:3-dehydroquinate dehydratase/shikimate dehydrogenase
MATRILAPKFGAFLSFASLAAEKGSADGQVPHEQMENLYHFSRIGRGTDVYGVVANPVAHSMSPAIHNAAFEETGMDAVYLPFRVDDPEAFLDGYQPYDLRGLSVTIPHKEAMLQLMDETDELCKRVGALNTVVIRNGRRMGYNTDVAAAVGSIEDAAARAGFDSLRECTGLLVGAGGAARAIGHGLVESVARLVVANRTESRGRKLAAELDCDFSPLDRMEEVDADIIINSTSVGMSPETDATPVPAHMLKPGIVVFDAVYNPIRTRLLREADEAGCVTASGFNWFVAQAAAQFELWTQQEPPREVMAEVVREQLGE